MKEKKINQARYVYQKNLTNLEIKTLTFSQHEKIQELCEMRHKLHSGDMFSTESSCLSECSRYFFERIKIEGVGFLDVGYEIENLTTEIDSVIKLSCSVSLNILIFKPSFNFIIT